jgi:hypothetical protein
MDKQEDRETRRDVLRLEGIIADAERTIGDAKRTIAVAKIDLEGILEKKRNWDAKFGPVGAIPTPHSPIIIDDDDDEEDQDDPEEQERKRLVSLFVREGHEDSSFASNMVLLRFMADIQRSFPDFTQRLPLSST